MENKGKYIPSDPIAMAAVGPPLDLERGGGGTMGMMMRMVQHTIAGMVWGASLRLFCPYCERALMPNTTPIRIAEHEDGQREWCLPYEFADDNSVVTEQDLDNCLTDDVITRECQPGEVAICPQCGFAGLKDNLVRAVFHAELSCCLYKRVSNQRRMKRFRHLKNRGYAHRVKYGARRGRYIWCQCGKSWRWKPYKAVF